MFTFKQQNPTFFFTKHLVAHNVHTLAKYSKYLALIYKLVTLSCNLNYAIILYILGLINHSKGLKLGKMIVCEKRNDSPSSSRPGRPTSQSTKLRRKI